MHRLVRYRAGAKPHISSAQTLWAKQYSKSHNDHNSIVIWDAQKRFIGWMPMSPGHAYSCCRSIGSRQISHHQSASRAFVPNSFPSFEHGLGFYAFRDREVLLLALAPVVLASGLVVWPWMRWCGSGRGAWDIRRRDERVVRLESFL